MDINRLNLKLTARALYDFLLPRVCAVCGRKLIAEEEHVCFICLSDMPLTYFWGRSHHPMSDKFNECLKDVSMDGDAERYAFAAALFYYNSESEYRRIPWCLKYGRDISLGRYFSGMLGRRLAGSVLFADVDTVIPVPLHWTRRLKRGYNQAEIIAGEVADTLHATLLNDALSRTRRTRTQTKVALETKFSNVSGAFALNRNRIGTVRKSKHILLIDDTFTTGSTLTACFAALRREIPTTVRISCATLDYVKEA